MIDLHATVDSMLRFPGAPREVISELRTAVTLSNPAWARLKAAGKPVEYMDVPMSFCFAQRGDSFALPRGAVSLATKKVAKLGYKIKWQDRRVEGETISIPQEMPFPPRPFQAEAVEKLLRFKQGTAIAGCGGGKTSIAMDAISKVKRKTLILVHTEDLMDQWIEELQEKLGITAGIIWGSKFKPSDVTIGMIGTLVNRVKTEQFEEYISTVGFAIMDEAHHAPAESFMSVISSIPAKIRLALTATPKRGDGMGKAIFWAFGDELINVPTAKLLEMGFLMLPVLETVVTAFRFTPTSTDVYEKSHEVHRAILADERRLHDICSVMEHHAKKGETCLLLANSVPYVIRLGMEMHNRGVKAVACTGQMPKRARKQAMSDFRTGKLKFLIATSLADEGLNVPSLSRIAFAWPDSSESKVDQRTGRLMRLYDKEPVLIDFVDAGCEQLMNRYKSRARVYRRLGIKTPQPKELLDALNNVT